MGVKHTHDMRYGRRPDVPLSRRAGKAQPSKKGDEDKEKIVANLIFQNISLGSSGGGGRRGEQCERPSLTLTAE